MTGRCADLAPHLRVVVVLRYYADLTEREIATAIGRPMGTVKSRLHEARRRLAHTPHFDQIRRAHPTTPRRTTMTMIDEEFLAGALENAAARST